MVVYPVLGFISIITASIETLPDSSELNQNYAYYRYCTCIREWKIYDTVVPGERVRLHVSR